MNESKHDRFLRVAESRTIKIINMIKLLGNCANESVYEYNNSDVSKIFKAIDKELEKTKSKYQGTESESNKFRLR